MIDKEFLLRNKEKIKLMSKDIVLKKLTRQWFDTAFKHEYSYHFTWLGRPVIQFPQDLIGLQEIIWNIKPDLIIEMGIAHSGPIIFSASILELIGKGDVLAVDVDIRKHNKTEIEKHPLFKRITMIEGSSIEKNTTKKVFEFAKDKKKIMLLLDSNHTHKHVSKELELYSPLVTKGSYVIVYDTMVEDMPKGFFKNRPWDKGNNPKTAVLEFLKKNNRFKIDKTFENKLLITSSPDGYLKCMKNH